MKRQTILLAFVAFLTLLLAACGGSAPRVDYETKIDGGSLYSSDSFSHDTPGNRNTTKITVAPAVAPSNPLAPAATTPASFPPAPAAMPLGATVNYRETPTPINIKLRDGREINAPAGSSVTVEASDDATPDSIKRSQSAESHGNVVRTNAKEGAAGLAQGPASVNLKPLGDEGAGGGSESAQGKSSVSLSWVAGRISSASTGELWLWGIGICLILAGISMVLIEHLIGGKTDYALVGLLCGAGAAFIATGIVAEKYPIFFLFLLLALVGGVVWYLIYWKKKERSVAVSAGTSAGGTAPPAPIPAPKTPPVQLLGGK